MMHPKIWTEDFPVRLHDLDAGGNLSLLSICNFLQSAASNHARALGVALKHLQSSGHTWVLAQLKIHMDDYPKQDTLVQIHTWPAGTDRLYALREFRIQDGDGRLYGRAGSAWLIIDVERRRPVRVETFGMAIHQTSRNDDISASIRKLPAPGRPTFTREFQVRYRDMDVNQHVNNVSYVEWAVESLPATILMRRALRELEVNFLGEAHLGDRVVSQAQPLDDSGAAFVHQIIRFDSEESLVRAKTIWAEGAF
ncbi:hypothetical protein D3OALGA1CA_4088 [Olavius algarvensis associated proteobacterium Delta 3]|nr:hypothetical protein D3OALGB2SA_1002 [Olavius algarvensis associated proteobacterium Delta 3]CAB5145028.1 hypothetical protein D3OALGA1CA_4088 [Olavius algarvensis associated proteobacterium Delta 3]